MIVSGLDGHGEEIKDKKVIMERALEFCAKVMVPEKMVKIILLILFCLECSESKKTKLINKIR